jgi:glycosyltransferase involved in cell wall biosynthesis
MISIIIPTFNISSELVECLDSLRSQTLSKDNYEVLIIDDASMDNSFEIANLYSKKMSNIRCFQLKTNKGPGIARNKGLDNALGDFILFLDGDDLLPKNALKELWEVSRRKGVEVVVFNWAYSDNIIDENKFNPEKRDLDRFTEDKNELVKKFLSMNFDGSVIYTLTRKKLFDNYHIRFPEGLHEDISVVFMIYYYAKNIFIEYRVMYLKRKRAASIVSNISRNHIDGYFRSWVIIKNFLINEENKDFSHDYLVDYLKGVTGLIAITVLKNIEINKENMDMKHEIYKHIFDLLQEYFANDFTGITLPNKTKYDRIANCFIRTFTNSGFNESSVGTFEKEALRLGLFS